MLEQHIGACENCRGELEKARALHAMLEDQALEPPLPLLADCRRDLRKQLSPEAASPRAGWLFWLPQVSVFLPHGNILKPVGAVALVALGFFAARISSIPGTGGFQFAGATAPAATRVRYVETGEAGKVQLVVDETRQRVLSGRIEDPEIRGLLLVAVRDPNDPGLRAESVDLLKARVETEEIRKALIHILQHDSNAAVRLKALEGLKAYGGNSEVRRAVAQVLLSDNDPGVRTIAVDLLVASKKPDVVGVLQQAMEREDNSYVRQRCERVLLDMKASPATF
jgi:hypothetical protein